MTLYYSIRTFTNEVTDHLRKLFPRGDRDPNYLAIERASTIDEDLLVKYFDCAVAKQHELYKVFIALPISLEDRIPLWFVQSDGEVWVDPQSGLRGRSIYRDHRFITKFNLFVDEKDVHSHIETKDISVERALCQEFIEIREALILGNEEPIDIFKGIYGHQGVKEPKSQTARYLASILTTPH